MDDKELFQLAHKVADMAFEYVSPHVKGNFLTDQRNADVNPYYKQTQSGLFITFAYIPSEIWTPWGKWRCWGSGSSWDDDVKQTFLRRIGAVEYNPKTTTKYYGTIYAITSIDGVPLPPAIERNLGQYLDYDKAEEIWKALK